MHREFEEADQNPEWHPGEGDLLLYVDGELPSRMAAALRAHLSACWACRVKAEKVEATIAAFMEYRNRLSAKLQAPAGDSTFRLKLSKLAIQQRAQRPWWTSVREIWRLFSARNFRAQFTASAVMVAALMVSIGLKFFWPLSVTAGELLAKSSTSQEVKENDVSLVLHRSLVFEEHRSGDNKLLERRRIDEWHGGKLGVTARRVFDEAGHLVAGEWSQRDGSSEIFRSGLRRQTERHPPTVLALLKTPEELWRFELSAKAFRELIVNSAPAQVKRQGAYYVVSFAPDHATGTLLEAVLTVRRDDLRAVGVDLLIASAADSHSSPATAPLASEHYSIVETSFEEEPAASAKSRFFEPDPALVASEPVESPQATAELQIQTTYLMDQIGATLGQQITVVIGADQKLHVEGVVETEGRKAEILNALAPVRSNPAVSVKVMSYAEVLRRARSSSLRTNAGRGTLPPESAAEPVQAELSEYFATHIAPGQQVDLREQVRQFSQQVMGDSSEAMRHAWVLKWLAEVLPPAGIDGLSDAAQRQYFSMLAEHAQQVGEHTRSLRLRLEPVFFPAGASQGHPTAAERPAGPSQTVDRLFTTVLQADKAVQSTFSVTFEHRSSASIRTPEFHHSLIEAEELACWIQNAAGRSGCNSGAADGTMIP